MVTLGTQDLGACARAQASPKRLLQGQSTRPLSPKLRAMLRITPELVELPVFSILTYTRLVFDVILPDWNKRYLPLP